MVKVSTVKHLRNQKDAPRHGMIRDICHAVVVAVNATKPRPLCAVDANWPTVRNIIYTHICTSIRYITFVLVYKSIATTKNYSLLTLHCYMGFHFHAVLIEQKMLGNRELAKSA